MAQIIAYDEGALVRAIDSWGAKNRENLQTAIRRSSYAALQVAQRRYRHYLEQADLASGAPSKAFERRRGAIMKKFKRSAYRVRVRPTDSQTLAAKVNLTHIAAGPIEFGGVYEQWVKEHQRRIKTGGDAAATKPVRGFKRLRWEENRHPLGDAMDETQGVFERIANFAIKRVAEGHEPPKRDELVAMA